MLKELKYFFYIVIIFFFLFITGNYYFSDNNKKISYRSMSQISERIVIFSKNLQTLNSDTDNIIEYVENNKDLNKKKKKYNFWKLLTNDD